jgi:hypothetical protein
VSRIWVSCLVLFALATPAGALVTAGGAGLTVSVESNGSYGVSVPGLSWEFHGDIGAPLTNVILATGADAAGAYQEISFDFVTDAIRHAAIRAYTDRAAVLFIYSAAVDTANTFSFPAWKQYPGNLNHLTYSGIFAPPSFTSLAEESPWIFFDSSYKTFILSSAANFMAASTNWTAKNEMTNGISPLIKSLPVGFEHRTILVVGQGINRTFDAWGQTVTSLTGKRRPANDADRSLNQVGYWTDNGATYYYQTANSMNYEQTLSAVKSDFDRMGIGLGYIQLDSWFYPKGAGALWSNNGQGIYEYVAASPLFSAGLSRFQQRLGVPLITHSRWIDTASPYRKSYRMSGNVVLDPAYWDTVAGYLSTSGVATYEQDWLADNAHTDFNLTDGAEFLDNMAASMAARNVTMQYCMAGPRHFMQGSKYSNLTTIRTSADRLGRDRWNDFLYTSRFASALGMWPFTDNFKSTETTHLLIGTLSAGPIGLSDAVGSFGAANILHAVRKDGVIVKPDVPLTPIDASYLNTARGVDAPQLHATYSDFGALRTYYLFAYQQGSNSTGHWKLSDFGAASPVYVYDYFAGAGQVVHPTDAIDKAITGDALYLIAAPIGHSGMAVLGDLDQFVSMGRKRISDITDDGRVHLTVAFAQGETARTIQGYSPVAPVAVAANGGVGSVKWDAATHRFSVSVTPGSGGSASIELRRSHPRSHVGATGTH